MKTLEKHPESEARIRFPDCDPFNHLNNSKYIDYIINAREDHLLNYYDFDLHKIARESGISWVVAQNQIAYLSPAVLMETVIIQTRLIHFDDKSLLMEAIMWDKSKTRLKAVLWSKFAHFNLRTMRSEIHSPEFTALFESLVNPLSESVSFEERTRILRQARHA
ncbi:thioesterase [Sphingobacteriaceae bacterium]|nr:thioesterase [Sphingobacteriaceae bacterium]